MNRRDDGQSDGRRDLTAVGALIDQVLAGVARSDIAPIVSLRQSWDEVAGEWAARCRPVGLTAGVLTVEVAHGRDASLLKFAGDAVVEGARRHLGDEPAIERLAVRVGRSR